MEEWVFGENGIAEECLVLFSDLAQIELILGTKVGDMFPGI